MNNLMNNPAFMNEEVTFRIAVIIPVFRHSVLLVDAIESILEQKTEIPIKIVVINDGCPHEETDIISRNYSISHSDKIDYIKKKNGGLSDARNFGIKYALSTYPTVDAIYLLDSDNRLRPKSLENAYKKLANDQVDFVYPNIDMFGVNWAGDYGGDYSLLIHSVMNICEAGSLIHRRVFEKGIFFDTDFKSGFEDWEFFFNTTTSGFKCKNLDSFGFQYRKRPESMLADSTRDESAILHSLYAKHKKFLQPSNLIKLEQSENPRYAIYLCDEGKILLTSDPFSVNATSISIEEFDKLYWKSKVSPSRYHIPPFLVVTSTQKIQMLSQYKLVHWGFWILENLLTIQPMASLDIEIENEGHRFSFRKKNTLNSNEIKNSSILILTPELFESILKDKSSHWVDSVINDECQPIITGVTVNLPRKAYYESSQEVIFSFLALVHKMRSSLFRESSFMSWDWRSIGIPWRQNSHKIIRKCFNHHPAYPKVKTTNRHIGFILPLIEFGGVEKVAINMAQALKEQGWIPHLFITNFNNALLTEEWVDCFNTINFIDDNEINWWSEFNSSYYGTDIPNWAKNGNHGKALGLLYWLDVVINYHSPALSGIMGSLKRFGVKTMLSLHLSDLSKYGRATGNTYLGLAYEHAYDIFLPCSYQLGDWCHSVGIPQDKIIAVPNAASFPASNTYLLAAQQKRLGQSDTTPIKILYLGRLDKQKGIDKLDSLLQETLKKKLNCEWKIIGKSIISEDIPQLSDKLRKYISPPLHTQHELLEIYEWADVLILLSDYEGLPLTILEAMRSGVVPITTNVGAISEVIENRVNGILLDADNVISDALNTITELSHNRVLLKELSSHAFNDSKGKDWVNATANLHKYLNLLKT